MYVVHTIRGFIHLTMEQCPNDRFNLTENIPTLVVGVVTMVLKVLDDPEEILDSVNPVTANVEEI